jgi:uncharacterized protein
LLAINKIFKPFIIIIVLLIQFNLIAQDSTKSLAFKKNRPYKGNPYFYQPDLSYQLLQQFKLVQIANSGDPLAQHELGLRLLTGEGIAADTVTAVYWIKKAASQKLTSALYNYGIMLINGWGTEWNPFLAYDNFVLAADAGMKEAQYVVGILQTDNLIVPRNWNQSYYWLKKSAELGYEPARDVIKEITPKISTTFKDSVDNNKLALNNKNQKKIEEDYKIQPASNLVFIDFETQNDTVKDISDLNLINDLNHLEISLIEDSLNLKKDSTLSSFYNDIRLKILRELADNGSHEAQTILGKLYQQGDYTGKNLLLAAEYYIRATILDSPRAAFLLWKLIREKEFYNVLNDAVQLNDPTAQFVWYGLQKLGYDNRLTEKDAIDLLQKAAKQNHIPSVIELGFNYYTGNYINLDRERGIALWKQAENLKSNEAIIRISASKILDQNAFTDLSNEIKNIRNAESKGSILAQFTLAYCYENGIGLSQNTADAVKYYRLASQRGNQFAFEKLKSLYDKIRPNTSTFKLN